MPVPIRAAELWSSPIMPPITMLDSIATGDASRGSVLRSTSSPPYSPDLNPIERVWKLTRRRGLHNRYFATLEEVIVAVETEFANWTMRNETLRRLCNYLRRPV